MTAARTILPLLLLVTSPWQVAAGQLTHAGNLTVARRDVSATMLSDGRIAVAGGPTESLEVLERQLAVISSVPHGATRLPLVAHTATRLTDGRVVLIGGGYQTDGRPTFGIYGSADVDVVNGTRVSPLTLLEQPRNGHAATLLSDGRILVTGGHTTNLGGFHIWETILASTEIVDPASATSRVAPPMMQARTRHTATVLPDGRVLIAGGHTENLTAIASAEIFDPSTGLSTRLADMRAARYGHTATLMPDGRVLIAGGADEPFDVAEFFDPATNEFAPAPGVDIGYRRHHTATLLHDGTLFIAGGAEDAVLYDPASNTIVDQVLLGGSLHEHAAVLLPSGDVLLIGGFREWYIPSAEILRYSRGPGRRRAVR